MYLLSASRSIHGWSDRRIGQYTSVPISFCNRSTAETKTPQGHELALGRVNDCGLALVRVLTLPARLAGEDDDVGGVAGVCCGGGRRIAWMMVLISESVIDRSLMPSNNNPTSVDDDDDDDEPTDDIPNSLNSCKHKP